VDVGVCVRVRVVRVGSYVNVGGYICVGYVAYVDIVTWCGVCVVVCMYISGIGSNCGDCIGVDMCVAVTVDVYFSGCVSCWVMYIYVNIRV